MQRTKQICDIRSELILNSPVTALPFHEQIELMIQWAQERVSRVVCVANVHMLMEAYQKPEMGYVLQRADLVTPDGMPLVWMLKLLGVTNAERVAGLDILAAICTRAAEQQIPVFFLGSDRSTLKKMRERLDQDFPGLQIAGMEDLPFRPLTIEEDQAIVDQVNISGAGLVFVCLGCPKQEMWMTAHREKIQATMLGLGGAFPVYAGIQRRAPAWIRSWGLEWAYRLVQEPRRLWKRYVMTIPPFSWLAAKQLFRRWFASKLENSL
jgi:N-acetylglucosaminyldiphosphoundecaprenol N-acetyl-beta-D-mannosaminyltransferase